MKEGEWLSFKMSTICAIISDKPFSIARVLIFLLASSCWSGKNGTLALQGCGSVVSNTLTSPGYPNNYPSNMHCSYTVPIPDGKAMKIDFRDFDVGYLATCSDDYLKITNEQGQIFGVFCRVKTGKVVLVTGTSAVIKFLSDFFLGKRGFQLYFTLVPLGNDTQPPAECSEVVNKSLRSPGYPKNYPKNMHCVYSVNIPSNMEMKIEFNDFEMEEGPSCFCDYLKITGERNKKFGVYCGMKTSRDVFVNGDSAVITFHSDYSLEKKGFLLFFAFIPIVPPKITSPGPIVRSLPWFRLTCSATGTSPIYTAIIRKYSTLINTTNTAAIKLEEEGNYTCVATNKHGTDVKHFLVIFNDCGPRARCLSFWNPGLGNYLKCRNKAPLEELVNCTPVFTNKIDFSMNAITSLHYGIFGNFSELKKLDLSWNSISSLPDGIFDNLTILRTLDLSSNVISSLPAGIFYNLESLVTLDLSSNAITSLPVGVFNNVKNLDFLYLSKNIITSLPHDAFNSLTRLSELSLSSNALTSLPEGVFNSLTKLVDLDFSLNAIAFLRKGMFNNLTELSWLNFSSNALTFLPEGVFNDLIKLDWLDFSANRITLLREDLFYNLIELNLLYFSSNNIQFLPDNLFLKLKELEWLDFSSNSITYLSNRVFSSLKYLMDLKLDSNFIRNLGEDVFSTLTSLNFLSLSSNNIQQLSSKVFQNTITLHSLDLSFNEIQHLPNGIFCCMKLLGALNLASNKLHNFTLNLFSPLTALKALYLSYNRIQYLPNELFGRKLSLLALQNNMINFISNETFVRYEEIEYLFLSANQLNIIPYRSLFTGMRIIMLSDNPITTIEPEAFRKTTIFPLQVYLLRTKLKRLSLESFANFESYINIQMFIKNGIVGTLKHGTEGSTIYLNAIGSDADAVKLERNMDTLKKNSLISALLASGFRQIANNHTEEYILLLPCPMGTFSNSSSKGQHGCTECPPGGFYSDTFGYVAESCMKCPNGSFVAYDKAPGTSSQDCKACPEGTETDFFAGLRACKCLEGFYRTHLFNECHKCGHGLECKDDYVSLKPGYWWKWRNATQRHRYRSFLVNLMSSSSALDNVSVQYPYPIPTPYQCPVESSCKGGLDSPCEIGYKGPLCAVCSSGYFKQLQTCNKCPSKKLMMGQLSFIAITLMITVAVLVWVSKRKNKRDRGFFVIDMFLSKLKIVIGFYQVTYGVLEAFSFIKWPDSLQAIAKYSEILQLNILQIAPAHCLLPGLPDDAFGNLFAMMALNAVVIVFSGVAFGVRKLMILKTGNLDAELKLKEISQTRELMFKNVFFFLYVTYLSTCYNTAIVLPLACRRLCRDKNEDECNKYLKADYSVQCDVPRYNKLVIVAYISCAYLVALPVASLIALWRQQRVVIESKGTKMVQQLRPSAEMITGLRFLFENYKQDSWYWELVEMSRKVILTSGLILAGQESRSYIGLAWVMAGMYGTLFSWIRPVRDLTENRLMTVSLAVTVLNLGIGAVSRIPAENIAGSSDPYVDSVVFKILVLLANTLVISLVVVQYVLSLYHNLIQWRKNPQWTFSCCLALLLPLKDLQGEISGIATTNTFHEKVNTEELVVPTILSAVQNSGAIDIVLEDDKQCDDTEAEVHGSHQGVEHKNKMRSHQETQTEPFSLSVAETPVDRPCGPCLPFQNEPGICEGHSTGSG